MMSGRVAPCWILVAMVLVLSTAVLGGATAEKGVTYDGRSLIIDGQRKLLFSGSIHYPRSTPEMWPSLIKKAKEGGIDVIQTYVFWNLHEPKLGQYDFSGRNDLVKFIKKIRSQGLYVSLRIGPFVEAEWNYGGLPFWLRDVPGMVYRTDNEPFKFHMQRFTSKIVSLMKSEGLYASQGGPIILSQIENEYGNVEGSFREKGASYVKWAAQMAVGLQTGVPWIMCKQPDAPDPVINTCNGMKCGETFPGPNSPNKPKMWTEDWTSFFQVYGAKPYIRSAEDIAFHAALFVAKNGSYINYYMYHGGTNFGRTSSSYFITGYYDQAPLDEYGLLRQPKYGHLKELHAAIKSSANPLLHGKQTVLSLGPMQQAYVFEDENTGCVAFLVNNDETKAIQVQFRNNEYSLLPKSIGILQNCKTLIYETAKLNVAKNMRVTTPVQLFNVPDKWEVVRETIPTFSDTTLKTNALLEHTNLTKDKTDYLWYTLRFEQDSPCTNPSLYIESLGHVVHVFVNNALAGSGHGSRNITVVKLQVPVSLINGQNNISILSGMVGLPDSGAYMERKSYGLTKAQISCGGTNAIDLSGSQWGYLVGLLGEKVRLHQWRNPKSMKWSTNDAGLIKNQPLAWYKTMFDEPNGDGPVGLNMESMGKGEVWVNGESIGRYWVSFLTPSGHPSQSIYHIPRAFLKPSGNMLVVFEEEGVNNVSIADGDLVASLLDRDQIDPLTLSLSVYKDGIVRLRIDEDHPPKKRFRVPDVVVSELDEKKIWLQKLSTETIDGDSSPSSIVYVSDGYEAVVRHEPFEVFVRERSGDRRRVVSLNSHKLFDFEQMVKKSEGDNWEEKFRTHTDSRPYGSQSISFDVSFYDSSFVYGIPEHATSFALRPTKGPGVEESEPYRLFNLDVFEYEHESPFGLYGSIPFMVSHGKSGKSSGFFWLNAAEMQIDVLAKGWDAESGVSLSSGESRIDTLWMSEAGIVDTFFFVGPEPKDVVKQYASVTGTSAMPQLFATGYHQCRWNYKDEEDVAQVDSKFDEHDIPYDVLWLDIEHTDGKRYFTWDSALFPHPEEMQKKLAAKGRRMVTIVDPHIKRDDSYFLHKEATQMGYYVKDFSGKDFDGWCWPGSSSYIDMLSPEIREWWGGRFSYKNYVGSTPSLYIWNDMNEPSVFNGPEVTMPRDALHVGGVEHREVHNAYGYYFHMATSDGLVMRGEGKDRPFVLSRAIFPGTQRYGAIWTGDNTAEWEHLRVSVPMLLTLGLTGITFSGADIGGFFGNPEPELLVRWYQVGAYYPFFRGHAHHDTKRREPWLFGERNTELMRDAIHTRYTLLPYFYTLFREANVTGVPVLRPLWMEFPQDEATFSNDEAFMVGNGLLVQGVYTKGTTHASVYLPGTESWYDLRNGKTYVGGKTHKMDAPEESIPALQRAGTIIPRKDRFRRSSSQMGNDPYTLVVALNSSQEANGELYIDDGKSFEFRRGSYIHRRFVFSNGILTSTNVAPPQATLSSQCLIERIILLGHNSGPKSALVEPLNQKAEIEMGPLRMGGLVASSGTKVLTIRKPGVRVDQDWTIKIL